MPTRSSLIRPPSRCVVPEARRHAPCLVAPEPRQMAQREACPRRRDTADAGSCRRRASEYRGPAPAAPAASLAGLLTNADCCARLLGCLQGGYGVGAGSALA